MYLAGIRQLHIQPGTLYPDIKNDYIKMLLRGKKNSECRNTSRNQGDRRRPITPDVLTKIKDGLTRGQQTIQDKRMIWSACTMLFFGAFRASEILSYDTDKFDPRFTLCSENVNLCTDENENENPLSGSPFLFS